MATPPTLAFSTAAEVVFSAGARTGVLVMPRELHAGRCQSLRPAADVTNNMQISCRYDRTRYSTRGRCDESPVRIGARTTTIHRSCCVAVVANAASADGRAIFSIK